MLQDLHIMHEQNEFENIPILVEERGDAFRGIPKLRRLSLLEYLLGVPRASPSLSSCLSSFSSYRDLLVQTLHPHKTSTENSVRSVSIIKQITTLSIIATQFIFCFFIMSTVIQLFHGLIHQYKLIDSSKQANYASKTESVKNRTVCSNLNIHHTSGTPKILPKLGKINKLYRKTGQK